MGAEPDLREATSALDAILRDIHGRYLPSALSVAVVHDEDIIFARSLGYADLAASTPATEQTIFRVASITKLFTASMLLQLRDAGKLCLDDPIEKYIPRFRVSSRFPDPRPVTFRQVASHTSGLPEEAPLDYFQTLQFPTIDAILASLAETEMVFPAMSQYKYSNLGYAILGHALEVIAEQPYAEYVTDHILRPLDMTNSEYRLSCEHERQAATGYERVDQTLRPVVVPADLGAFAPAGQLYSCPADLARFISLQFHQGPATDQQILGGTTIREMHAPVLMDADWSRGIGLGWDLRRIAGYPCVAHDGGMPGFTANITVIPQLRLGVAACANTRAEPWSINQRCLETLIPMVSEGAGAGRVLPSRGEWHKYLGRYTWLNRSSLQGRALDIDLREGTLVAEYVGVPGATGLTLEPVGEDRFRIHAAPRDHLNGELATFVLGETGEVRGVRIGSHWLERVAGVSRG